MPKRVFSRTRSPRKRTSEFSAVSDGGMFESRPFVVQSKVGEEGEKSGLKTSLVQAERYGHHLGRIQPAGLSPMTALQSKLGEGQPVQSQLTKAPQVLQAKQTAGSFRNKYQQEADQVVVDQLMPQPTSQVQETIQSNKEVINSAGIPSAGGTIQMTKGSPFPKKTKQQIIESNRNKQGLITCTNNKCGFQHKQQTYVSNGGKRIGDGSFHIDHITPFSKGGKGTVANGRVLCGTCNTSRGNRGKIGETGMRKYPGLHGGQTMKVIKRKDYEARKKLWKNKKKREPLVPKTTK